MKKPYKEDGSLNEPWEVLNNMGYLKSPPLEQDLEQEINKIDKKNKLILNKIRDIEKKQGSLKIKIDNCFDNLSATFDNKLSKYRNTQKMIKLWEEVWDEDLFKGIRTNNNIENSPHAKIRFNLCCYFTYSEYNYVYDENDIKTLKFVYSRKIGFKNFIYMYASVKRYIERRAGLGFETDSDDEEEDQFYGDTDQLETDLNMKIKRKCCIIQFLCRFIVTSLFILSVCYIYFIVKKNKVELVFESNTNPTNSTN